MIQLPPPSPSALVQTVEIGDGLAEAQPRVSMIQFDRSQQRFFDDPSRVIVVNWHRQKGKDFTAAAKAIKSAMETGQDWFIVSLTQRQADATFAKMKKVAQAYRQAIMMLFGTDAVAEVSAAFEAFDKWIKQSFVFTAREIRLPNGARVVSLPGRDPDTLAGLTGNVIFTEFGLFPGGGYDHWGVVFPLTTRGYCCIIISTPRGKNTKFYELWLDKETYSVHTCDIYQSVNEEGFVLKDNHGKLCTIEQFRRLYKDEGKWPREYECKFTGDLQALIAWAQLEEAAALSDGLDFSFCRIEGEGGWQQNFFTRKLPSGGKLAVGWDVARTGHLSSVWVNHVVSGRPSHLRFLVLMHNVTFGLQRRVVRAAMDAMPSVGCGDNTGLGMQSNEELTQIYGDRWEGVNFGGGRKKELASGMVTAFSDRQQTIQPVDSEYGFIAADIYAVQKDDTGGQLLLDETDNPLLPESHCDIFYSGGLSRMAGNKKIGTPLPRPLSRKPVGW
jgi:phage FluMu gp28-like protein